MNKSDCFILDAGKEIFVYMGATSRRMERLKAIVAANAVRDDDHAGSSKVIIIGKFFVSVTDFSVLLNSANVQRVSRLELRGW